MTYKQYCDQIGITFTGDKSILQDIKNPQNHEATFTYRVPELTPDGTCSVHDILDAKPYDLRPILGISSYDDEHRVAKRLAILETLLDGIQKDLETNWIGIYQTAVRDDGIPVLVKLVYRGKPSRAEFPLTEEFEALSNNTKVGRTAKAIIIKDVQSYEDAYYTCDPFVKSEACLPIFNRTGKKVIGIVDAESFQSGFFDDERVARLAELCHILADYLPING